MKMRAVVKSLLGMLKDTLTEWWNDNTFRLAASLAFYTIFSLAPILLIAVGFVSLIFSQERASDEVVRQVKALAGVQGATAARQVLGSVKQIGGNPMAILIGFATLVVGSTAVFAELQSALNLIWDVTADPSRNKIKGLIRDRLLSFAIVLAVGFLLLVSLLISAAIAALHTYLAGKMPGMSNFWQMLNMVTSFGITALLFAMIYKYLPDVKITWRDVWVGALVTALLFTGGKLLIGMYLGQMVGGNVYGAAGSFVVLLIWVYYSALICFFGAEFTQVYARRYGSKIRPQEHAIRLGKKQDQSR
ncbi:MAG: YihY/virulence factor BrkB family protein [Desulfoferrobacter sp.]